MQVKERKIVGLELHLQTGYETRVVYGATSESNNSIYTVFNLTGIILPKIKILSYFYL